MNGALGVLLIGGAGYSYLSLADGGGNAGAAAQLAGVSRGTVLSSVSASGSVESAKTESVNFGASGTVGKINVESGDEVEKGQVLAELDDTEARENLKAAKAALDAADDDTSTASGYSSYVSAKNSYNDAVRSLDGTVLKAPFSGTVTAVNGTVGGSSSGSSSSSSSSGTSGGSGGGATGGATGGSSSSSSSSGSSDGGFIELADVSKLLVKGEFTEADTTKLKVGQQATVSFAALSGTTASAKVTSIETSPTTNNNVVQYGVVVSLSTRPAAVRIGQTATVQVVVSKADDVLYVPAAAVRTAGGQSIVTVMQNGLQVARTVQTGITGEQGTEIKSGLQEGQQVVLTNAAGSGGNGFPGGGFPGGGIPGGGPGGGAGGAIPGGGRP